VREYTVQPGQVGRFKCQELSSPGDATAMSESPSSPESFQTLIARVRSGDEQAAAELVRLYEPAIRRAARVRLLDTRLNRLLDSMDICQSVMASFFVRTALGQYELETPDQLLKLLATMTRNKLANQVKGHGRARRDFRRVSVEYGDCDDETDSGAGAQRIAGQDPTPSRDVAARELLEEAMRRLSPEEKRILDRREQGGQWTEIAEELGSSPEAIRKRLARAVDRVAHELGLDESP
jgi:RNA polymerase sigma factor (sigma-70 family)